MRLVFRNKHLQARFDLLNRTWVEQFPQIVVAKQFLKLRLIDRQSLRTAFRKRSVTVVNVIGDIGEKQGRGEGRGLRRLESGYSHLSTLDLGQDAGGTGEIEHITNALPVAFEEDWKRCVAGCYREQIGSA